MWQKKQFKSNSMKKKKSQFNSSMFLHIQSINTEDHHVGLIPAT